MAIDIVLFIMFICFNDLSQSCNRMNFNKNRPQEQVLRYFFPQFFDRAGVEWE